MARQSPHATKAYYEDVVKPLEQRVTDLANDLERAVAEAATLRQALDKAADTFADIAAAFRLMGRHETMAEACDIAEAGSRAAASREGSR